MGKVCRKCNVEKELSDFYKNNYSKDKLGYECKSCRLIDTKKYRQSNPEKIKELNRSQYVNNRQIRIEKQKEWSKNNKDKITASRKRRLAKNPHYNRKWTLKKYGLSQEGFSEMLIGQFNSCWICGSKFNKLSDVHIDHCHNSKIVRGLLCSHCNTALGLVKENITTLKIMIEYLQNNKDGWKEF